MRKNRKQLKTNNRHEIIFPMITLVIIGVLFAFSSYYSEKWTYDWNGINQQIKDSVGVAENDNISGPYVGIAAMKSKQFDRRIWIMSNATEYELTRLTEYPNATIKAIAYEGLLRKKGNSEIAELVLNSMKETDYPVMYRSGCTSTPMNIGVYLVDFLLYINDDLPPPPEGKNQFKLSENDIQQIMTEYRNLPRPY